MDADAADLAGIAQADVRPRLAGVGGLVHADAGRDVAARARRSGAHVDDVRIDLADRDGPDRPGLEHPVADALPRLARVDRLPHAAPGGPHVVGEHVGRDARHRGGPAAPAEAERAVLQRREVRGIDDLVRIRRGGGRRRWRGRARRGLGGRLGGCRRRLRTDRGPVSDRMMAALTGTAVTARQTDGTNVRRCGIQTLPCTDRRATMPALKWGIICRSERRGRRTEGAARSAPNPAEAGIPTKARNAGGRRSVAIWKARLPRATLEGAAPSAP